MAVHPIGWPKMRVVATTCGYCEVHIEQGPVLEARRLPVGEVPAIAGQSRYAITFVGEAGHAGTVPMNMRRDALCAAAEFITLVGACLANGWPGRHGRTDRYTSECQQCDPRPSDAQPGRAAPE